MSEVQSTPDAHQPDESPTSPTTTAAAALTCQCCDEALEQSYVHASSNRTHTAFVCPACHRGAAAIVDRTPGDLTPLHAQRVAQTQQRLPTNPATDVLAAFIDDTVPPGTYRIERTGEHHWQLQGPATVDDIATTDLATRLGTATTAVDVEDTTLTVTDTRFATPEKPPRWEHDSRDDGTACPDGGSHLTAPVARGRYDLPTDGGAVGGTRYEPGAARTERARTEEMDVALLKKGGRYEVHSESGNTYQVDVLQGRCSCPDEAACCKHQRRVDLEIRATRVPRPDGRLPA
jgi:hypothetical protein